MSSTGTGRPTDAGLLGVYLNDHLAGATAGLELFRRAAREQGGAPAATLTRLAAEVAQDRQSLLQIMQNLDVPVRHYKVWGGWTVEKLGRLKLNGRVLARSPLSSLVELEALRLGIEGKLAGWSVLQGLAARERRLDGDLLGRLIARGRRQADELERLRLEAAAAAF